MSRRYDFNVSKTDLTSYLKTAEVTPDSVIRYEYVYIFLWINYGFLCQVVGLFGISTNIINIICFVKEGFKDPVNVSLFGLAVSDLFCLTTLMWTNICCTPAFSALDLPFDPIDFQYLTSGWPHVTFTRVSSVITAFITMERCLCITSPLKVKGIVTPKRASLIIVSIYLILISSVAPVYVVNGLGNVYLPDRNKTIIGLVYGDNREIVETVTFTISNIFVHVTSFLVIIICTIILVIQLKSNTQWRNKSLGVTQAETVYNRNQKVCKMVVMISILYIVCVIPVTFMLIAVILEPKLSAYGQYRDISILVFGMSFFLESINSSANIFIYYTMSSKYKNTFHNIICVKRE